MRKVFLLIGMMIYSSLLIAQNAGNAKPKSNLNYEQRVESTTNGIKVKDLGQLTLLGNSIEGGYLIQSENGKYFNWDGEKKLRPTNNKNIELQKPAPCKKCTWGVSKGDCPPCIIVPMLPCPECTIKARQGSKEVEFYKKTLKEI